MKAWWESLNTRERALLVSGLAVTVALLFYMLVWEPVRASRHQLQQTVATQLADLAWMRQAAQDIKRLGNSAPGQAVSDERSLLTLVDQTAKAADLGAAMKRVAPQGDDKLSAQLDGAEFEKLIPWLIGLEQQHHLVIVSLSVDRTDTPGLVNARVVLGRRS
jgi:general secretion pathway protein M